MSLKTLELMVLLENRIRAANQKLVIDGKQPVGVKGSVQPTIPTMTTDQIIKSANYTGKTLQEIDNMKQKENVDQRNKFYNNVLKLSDQSVANEIISDPRISGKMDSIIKINSVWPKFVSDLKEQYTEINPDIFIDYLLNYIETVKEKKETTNDIQYYDIENTTTGEVFKYGITTNARGNEILTDDAGKHITSISQVNVNAKQGITSIANFITALKGGRRVNNINNRSQQVNPNNFLIVNIYKPRTYNGQNLELQQDFKIYYNIVVTPATATTPQTQELFLYFNDPVKGNLLLTPQIFDTIFISSFDSFADFKTKFADALRNGDQYIEYDQDNINPANEPSETTQRYTNNGTILLQTNNKTGKIIELYNFHYKDDVNGDRVTLAFNEKRGLFAQKPNGDFILLSNDLYRQIFGLNDTLGGHIAVNFKMMNKVKRDEKVSKEKDYSKIQTMEIKFINNDNSEHMVLNLYSDGVDANKNEIFKQIILSKMGTKVYDDVFNKYKFDAMGLNRFTTYRDFIIDLRTMVNTNTRAKNYRDKTPAPATAAPATAAPATAAPATAAPAAPAAPATAPATAAPAKVPAAPPISDMLSIIINNLNIRPIETTTYKYIYVDTNDNIVHYNNNNKKSIIIDDANYTTMFPKFDLIKFTQFTDYIKKCWLEGVPEAIFNYIARNPYTIDDFRYITVVETVLSVKLGGNKTYRLAIKAFTGGDKKTKDKFWVNDPEINNEFTLLKNEDWNSAKYKFKDATGQPYVEFMNQLKSDNNYSQEVGDPKPQQPAAATATGSGLFRRRKAIPNNKINKGRGMIMDQKAPLSILNSKEFRENVVGRTKKLTKKIIGFGSGGVELTSEIEYCPFGKFIINTSKLEDNILRVIYANTYINIKELKSMKISDDFKNLLLFIIDNKQYNESLYKLLSKKEQDICKLLLEKSGVKKVLKINLSNSNDEYKIKKERWAVISGELNIGNNSDILADEARELLKWFYDNKYITRLEYNENLESIEFVDRN